MGTNLHQTLESLCFNTEWKYAVFWKLKHRARMVLTWEDAYYDNHEKPLENRCLSQAQENLHNGHCSHDPLGLAVAKMSYQVYSLGEGIVGQVAVSGKYQWIFADRHGANSCSSFEYCDGWQTQFLAGIKTIVVVAVVPLGVVQLGSLNRVIEDMNLVTHIRDVFSVLQDFLAGHIPKSIECRMKSSLHSENAFEMVNEHEGIEFSTLEGNESARLHWPGSKIIKLGYQKDKVLNSEHSGAQFSHYSITDNEILYNVILPTNNLGVGSAYFPTDLLDSAVHDRIKLDGVDINQTGVLQLPESSGMKFQKDLEKTFEFQTKLSHTDKSNASLKFPAGFELHEALGPDFLKKSIYFDWEAGKTEAGKALEIPEEMSSGQLTFDSGTEHLLEAVVAQVCHSSSSDVKSEKSLCKSVTTEKMSEPSNNTKCTMNSFGYSINQSSLIEEDAQLCLNSSEVSGLMSSKGFSSTCPSTCSEQFERSSEPAKNSKKRARPGENSRPRPRDRQLIQDRIKELRELVPSGSKCSIDSLLERTIKHMLFLQSITKHASKLNKCASSKLSHKETGQLDSSTYEQGSSWAVEVGSHLKVCSIIVENLNKKGQMLVKMVCEECSHFLEIAEAIRSLGLTILKGFTEAHGEKTWICFVVEGLNNGSIHRMDTLWSLVQILQPKTGI